MTAPAFWGLKRFAGKVALVTGGASGIGRATAIRLASEGACVWICDLPGKSMAAVPRSLNFFTLDLNVTDESAVCAAADRIIETHGRLDVVVNCAGITSEGTAHQASRADWQRMLDVNLTGTFLVCRYTLPIMIAQRTGSVVNVASDAALIGQRGQAAYCASKGGVTQFTRAAALDAAPYSVRVNAVCPCFVDTPLLAAWIAASPNPESVSAEAAASQPMGRVGKPEEVAAAITFLASDEASFVTGAILPVDGGATVP